MFTVHTYDDKFSRRSCRLRRFRFNEMCNRLKHVLHAFTQLSKLKLREIDGETGEVLRTHTPEELEGCEEDLQTRITVLDSDVAAMKPNMAAIDEYNAKHEVRNALFIDICAFV